MRNSYSGRHLNKRHFILNLTLDTSVDIFNGSLSGQSYYYFRYAEVLLNYAKAQNEALYKPVPSIYAALDATHDRAGVPNFFTVYPDASKDKMRDLIRRGRRIELAFEDKRLF